MLGFYADTIREGLGVDPSMKLLFGISFGYPDTAHKASQYRIPEHRLKRAFHFIDDATGSASKR